MERQPVVSYSSSYRRCGKPACRVCDAGKGHGPYWYARWRAGGKVVTRYLGRERPEALARHPLTIRTLGGLDVQTPSGSVTSWSKRNRSLLGVLLSAPTGWIGRDELVEILWPETDVFRGLNNLKVAISRLRKALGRADLIRVEGIRVVLAVDDVARDDKVFEIQAREALRSLSLDAIASAIALYTGDFLPEAVYDDWSQYRREQLLELHRRLLVSGAERARLVGDPVRAVEWLRWVIARDPLDEPTTRSLMVLLAESDRRADALRLYRSHAESMHAEFAMDPSSETTSVYDRIVRGG
jgi:LuxR family maltose regulon positive regulatory protein